MSRSQFTWDRDRSRKSGPNTVGAVSPVPIQSEPEPIFGPGTDSGTEFITEFISISALKTKECMKKSEPAPQKLEPEPKLYGTVPDLFAAGAGSEFGSVTCSSFKPIRFFNTDTNQRPYIPGDADKAVHTITLRYQLIFYTKF
jgi:hypothetical protein